MLDFNSQLLIIGAVILVAAFLGSWLAGRLHARHPAHSVPVTKNPETATPPPPKTSLDDVKHAFDFDDDRVSMIVEMPVAMLSDDAILADVWIDVVGWARVAWADTQAHRLASGDGETEETLDQSEITSEHLEGSLQRLHEAAERRRELRLKLAQQSGKPLSDKT
jgi:nucleoside-diphosphate-sugar epimerase